MLTILLIISVVIAIETPLFACTEAIVITHKDSDIQELSKGRFKKLFLKGKSGNMRAVNLPKSHHIRQLFSQSYLGMSIHKVEIYYSKIALSVRWLHPVVYHTQSEVVDLVSRKKNFVAYICHDQLSEDVKQIEVK